MTSGDWSVFPGVTAQSLHAEIVKAVNHCITVLTYFEKVMKEDHLPPEYLWPFADELDKWWKAIKEEINGESGGSSDEPSGPLVENEYAERFR